MNSGQYQYDNNFLGEDWNLTQDFFFENQFEGTPRIYDESKKDGSSVDDAGKGKKKVSDAITYGPKFCELFHTYKDKLGLNIDISRHLMSLCVDHLITFANWARESEKQVAWVSKKLNNYDYLRPEVRNGIIIVLIYTFASIKATIIQDSDMFITLEDHEQGLGIANKFSLKIYNDPYNFLIFLKIALSCLIDAKAILDNERVNQPKKSKEKKYENEEEVHAFHQIRGTLTSLLDGGNIAGAKNFVGQITNYWQTYGKTVRYNRLARAWASISDPTAPAITLKSILEANGNNSNPALDQGEMSAGSKRLLISTTTSTGDSGEAKKRKAIATSAAEDTSSQTSTTPIPPMLPHGTTTICIPILKFERIGMHEWDIKEMKVYAIDHFLASLLTGNNVNKSICLVDEGRFLEELHDSKFNKRAKITMTNLEQELQLRQSLVTVWKLGNELQQLIKWLEHYRTVQETQHKQQQSLLQFWMDDGHNALVRSKKSPKMSESQWMGGGVLVYETVAQMIVIVRKCPELNISSDMWCCLYQSELQQIFGEEMRQSKSHQPSFGDLLTHIFPQLLTLKGNVERNYQHMFPTHGKEIAIKYYAHHDISSGSDGDKKASSVKSPTNNLDKHSNMMNTIPEIPHEKSFQTIGTFSSHAEYVLAKFNAGIVVHDIVFEYIRMTTSPV